MNSTARFVLALAVLAAGGLCPAQSRRPESAKMIRETAEQRDARMKWWREARFGVFIHWGLYAIPAGEWGDRTNHGEWIMHTAQIPAKRYERYQDQFNPVKFDAADWVRTISDAGAKYIVITSKHHDGFCLFDSAHTDYDIMSTPFKRDIMQELSAACRQGGLRMCWYHSIMDWHHPDYLPRRSWEKRSAEGADYERYVQHMKAQVAELLTNYGPIGVMWFDGEWEGTWTHAHGLDLYAYVRQLQSDTIINNRVDKGRGGMEGMTKDRRFAGDFGTPEQEIPATGLPGVDWETCMTMNDHWGYNRFDDNWKSSEDLIRKLADIASKGGNFLLNVGPKADGTFPPESIKRLREMGEWMTVYGESIYGTQASPFKTLPWGRCTQKRVDDHTTRLYLHVFDWPVDGKLLVPGIFNQARAAYFHGTPLRRRLPIERDQDALVIQVPPKAPNAVNSVIALDIVGRPDVNDPPTIAADAEIFVDVLEVAVTSDRANVELRYTTDGSEPTITAPRVQGPVRLTDTATITARAFRDGQPVSGSAAATFTKVTPRPSDATAALTTGLKYEYFEGDWNQLPDFGTLTPIKVGPVANFDFAPRDRTEHFGFRYTGFVTVPRDGVYTFYTLSDDGSRLYIGQTLVVDNDGLHGMQQAHGEIALAAGQHRITVTFFEKAGGDALEVEYAGPGIKRQPIPYEVLMRAQQISGPTPAPRQLAWQQLELTAFIHFTINTFTDSEWGDGTEDPQLFNPTELDARQWVQVCKDAGMKQIILTAKHHDGFCLWPSKYTEHSVKNSPWRGGQGDLVREVADACREAGLKFGVYLSPWDRHEPTYGDSQRYNEHYKRQLTELLTNYGPIHEVWFDGACGEGPNGKRQVYDWPGYIALIRELQPNAVIFSDAGPDVRWVGNEKGFAGETNWSTLRRDEFHPGTPNFAQLTGGHEDGPYWVPAECDVSIRPGWFYHADQDDKVKTVAQLVDIYYKSVGRNGVLLLNIPPDRRGLIHEIDAARLAEFRRMLTETFRTNLAAGKTAGAGSQAAEHRAALAVDGDADTYWTTEEGVAEATLTIDLGQPVTFDRIMIQEQIRLGQRVRAFAVEVWDGGDWRQVATGTTIGYKRLLQIEPATATRVRLLIKDCRGAPAINEFGLFKASAGDGAAN